MKTKARTEPKLYWRVRFYADDSRPIAWPAPGPFWCSGYQVNDAFEADKAIVVAYLPKKADLKKFWPEAEVDEWYGKMPIQFSERFQRPDWWKESV